MSKLRSKTEVYFTPEIDQRLELLQRELSQEMGKKISKGAVVAEIVDLFFGKAKEILPRKSPVVEDVPQQRE